MHPEFSEQFMSGLKMLAYPAASAKRLLFCLQRNQSLNLISNSLITIQNARTEVEIEIQGLHGWGQIIHAFFNYFVS